MNLDYFLSRTKAHLRRKFYRAPSKEEVHFLIKSLRPKSTDKELIRLGGNGDGGYLLPDDLENMEACFSPGVGRQSNFELECAARGMKVYMADASIEQPAIHHPDFHFIKKFIGGKSGKEFITLEDWLRKVSFYENVDLLLQMDIEGYEYEVLNSTSIETLKKFRIIIIEFHMLTSLAFPFYFQRARESFEKLLLNHTCVHIHPNNASGMENIFDIPVPGIAEFTFLRKDRIREEGTVEKFPHPLDLDNSKNHETIVLPEFWFK